MWHLSLGTGGARGDESMNIGDHRGTPVAFLPKMMGSLSAWTPCSWCFVRPGDESTPQTGWGLKLHPTGHAVGVGTVEHEISSSVSRMMAVMKQEEDRMGSRLGS